MQTICSTLTYCIPAFNIGDKKKSIMILWSNYIIAIAIICNCDQLSLILQQSSSSSVVMCASFVFSFSVTPHFTMQVHPMLNDFVPVLLSCRSSFIASCPKLVKIWGTQTTYFENPSTNQSPVGGSCCFHKLKFVIKRLFPLILLTNNCW